jgi:hypothetical protein
MAALLAVGCSPEAADPAATPSAIAEAARTGAKFRSGARDVYVALLQESCERDPALARAKVLAAERSAMQAFEKQIGTSPAATQLAFARTDIEYRQAHNALGCWNDGHPSFAQMHVKMARDSATQGLAGLRTAAPTVPRLAGTGALDPGKSVEFRTQVRDLVERLNPQCQMIAAADNDSVLAASRAELEKLRERLKPTAWFLPFVIAEADILYEQSNVMVECAAPGPETADQQKRAILLDTRARIARLAATAGLQ